MIFFRSRSTGSISACAEAPRAVGVAGGKLKVYLRVCGGTTIRSGRPHPCRGLSPRVRRHQTEVGRIDG